MTWLTERRSTLAKLSHDDLVAHILNQECNHLVGHYADYRAGEHDPHGHGKRVPYIGWFWRSLDFAAASYTIGHCGAFIGFMENNKWGYPERYLIPAEAEQVTAIVDTAMVLDRQGGNVAKITQSTKDKLSELWPLLQSFPITVAGWWIYGPLGRVAFAENEEEAENLVAALSDAGPGLAYQKVKA